MNELQITTAITRSSFTKWWRKPWQMTVMKTNVKSNNCVRENNGRSLMYLTLFSCK